MPSNSPVPFLSIVSPVYQAAGVLDELLTRLQAVLQSVTEQYEILLVDDGSSDTSWSRIVSWAAADARIKGLRLSRNFGQHYALTAGLAACQGEWVAVMDCDLQDQPEAIPQLLARAQQGYDAVLARRANRTHETMARGGSWLFYWVLTYLTGQTHDTEIGNFGVYHRQLVSAVLQLRDSTRYFPTMVRWVGFRQTSLEVEHGHSLRPSSYSLYRRLQLALDILLTYSDKPLRMAVYFGLALSGMAFLLGFGMLVRYVLGQITVPGYASLIVSISLFSGIIISLLGLVGLYVGKTFEEVRARPLYVVAETTDTL